MKIIVNKAKLGEFKWLTVLYCVVTRIDACRRSQTTNGFNMEICGLICVQLTIIVNAFFETSMKMLLLHAPGA